ncbi:MAG: hypothetical protein IPL86_16035 [Flavobacteriales bacterium]|nr:hypothetical protein [Flavobacteriales bacterium]
MWLAGKNAVPAGKVAQIEREAPAFVANRLNCQYCGRAAKLVRGVTLYPGHPETHDKYFWRCAPCGAHVGCHPRNKNTKGKPNDGKIPLGSLANKELRRARNRAHAMFDPLWRKGKMKRGEAYSWLRETLGISKEACHIGRFDVELCNRTVDAVAALKKEAK